MSNLQGGFGRREFLRLSGAAGSLAIAGCATTSAPPQKIGRVIVIGGGYGGATAAKYLRMWSEGAIEVFLIERNAAFVISYLKTEKMRVLAEDLNDVYPRKVYFFPKTGKVLVKKLVQAQNDTLAKRELDYARRLKVAPVGGAIDLF